MEKEYLLTATQGRGILILDNEHQELEVVASPKEHSLITTNPNEILIQTPTKNTEKKKKIKINVDSNRKLFFDSELTEEERHYLTNKKFKVYPLVPIGKTRSESVWLLKNPVESEHHTFMVENIKLELEKLGVKSGVAITKEADVIFKNKKGKTIAIEVETGKGFKKHRDRLIEKFTKAKRKYDSVAIVLTDSNLKKYYEHLHLDIPLYTRATIGEFLLTKMK